MLTLLTVNVAFVAPAMCALLARFVPLSDQR
jgi:hypothetical protein